MQATRTPPAANPRHQGRQPPPAPSPAGPGTQILTVRSEEEFLSRFGANHIHAVWRDLADDWGEDTLAAHYRAVHPVTG